MRILISILSDYLMANFLLIKEMAGSYDSLLFITTQDMLNKKKGVDLERSLGVPDNSISRIVVAEDDLSDIRNKLMQTDSISDSNEYIVNLTGGTKIMSIAIYDYFRKYDNVSYYYIPIGKNIMVNLNNMEAQPLKYRVNLKEYFLLNGLTIKVKDSLCHNMEVAYNLFEKCRQARFNVKGVKEIRNAHSLTFSHDRTYYSGEWFEEYTYYRIKEELMLDDDSIATNVYIQRDSSKHPNDNEIDVMFTKDNELYVCECKVGLWGYGMDVKSTTESYLYKLAAVSKDFGLKVKSYLITLQNMSNPKVLTPAKYENIKDRARILGIKGIIDCNKLELTEIMIL